jgi:glycosyltransferase involved in cell wall biosynthesis
MPKVSVIIPVYNGSHTIAETLQYVLRQSYRDFEVLIIDDGSTDALMEALKPFHDSRVQVFHYENGGLPVARNRGIDRSTGEYLIFLDADDLWSSDKLESHLRTLETARKTNPKVGVAYSWNYFLDDVTYECFTNETVHYEGDVLPVLLTHNFIANGSNPMIARDAIDSTGRFREDLTSAEDWDYWIKLAHQWEFVLIPKRQVFYRQIQTSMSSSVDKMERAQVQVIDAAFNALPDRLNHLKLLRKTALANVYFYCAQLYSRRQLTSESLPLLRQKLFQALSLNPKLLSARDTRILFIKYLLLQILSPERFQRILQSYRQWRSKQPNPTHPLLSDLMY